MEDEQHFCVGSPALEKAGSSLVDAGALSDKDKSNIQSPDSKTAKLLYNMLLKRAL